MTVLGGVPLSQQPDARAVLADPRDAWRREPAKRKRAYVRRHSRKAPPRDAEQLDRAVESVIGSRDFLPGRWLRQGGDAADAVGRVRTPGSFGTGFLVTPWLLMTNHHVLENAQSAQQSTVTFRYVAAEDDSISGAVKHQLEPARCFVTSPLDELDMTLVAVAASKDHGEPGKTFGWLPAKAGTGKILIGMPVNVLQHPDGRPEEVALRNNLLLTVEDDRRLTYGTDTEPGSSGSPVLNDDWEVVALHHRGGGAVGGTVIGNEGIRISAIVAFVAGIVQGGADGAGTDAADLLGEFLTLGAGP